MSYDNVHAFRCVPGFFVLVSRLETYSVGEGVCRAIVSG